MAEWLIRSVKVDPAVHNWTRNHLFSDSNSLTSHLISAQLFFLEHAKPHSTHLNPRKATIDLNHYSLHYFNQTHFHIEETSLASHLHRPHRTSIL
ncbi:hypothetical protein GBA52_008557 [Prunus armeniaca]|nr:hypothetical protein GBA52_008557 [Prunus armeniaca]